MVREIPQPKVLLISLLGGTDNVGVKYLHASLMQADRDSSVLFLPSEDPAAMAPAAEFIDRGRFDIVGISFMTAFLPKATALTRAIRDRCGKRVTIVWGGVHTTIAAESCPPGADYLCVGEAETAFVEFVERFRDGSEGEVEGFNRPGDSSFTACPPAGDLDALPFPHHYPPRTYVMDRGKVRVMTPRLFRRHSHYAGSFLDILTARGCPYQCSYCSNHLLQKIYGRDLRKRSPENVLAEIHRNVAESPVRFNYVYLNDDCFIAHSDQWLEAFVEGYRDIGVPIVFKAIPAVVTERKIRILCRAPVGFALCGLQSGSERTNRDIYNRPFSREKFLRCARLLHRHGIPATYDVIVDNPYETPDDWRKTIELVGSLPSSAYLLLYSLTFYPNTLLYERARADGLDVDAHRNKSQVIIERRSREAQLVRLAMLIPKEIPLALLNSDTRITRLATRTLAATGRAILEPLRMLRLARLSQQKNPRRLVRLLRDYGREFCRKMFFPRRMKEGYRPEIVFSSPKPKRDSGKGLHPPRSEGTMPGSFDDSERTF